MKEYIKQPLTIIGIVLLIVFGIIYFTNDYMDSKTRKCLILDKLTTIGGYKSPPTDFWLVVKEERGIVFDLIVSPATFSQSKIGDTKYFCLREMDIKQTPLNNVIYFFGQIISGVLAFMFLVLGKLYV